MKRLRPFWAIVAAACAVVVMASVVGSVATGMGWQWREPGGSVAIKQGGLHWLEYESRTSPGGNIALLSTKLTGWWFGAVLTGNRRAIVVPLWAFGLVGTVCGLIALRRARIPTAGYCERCEYDLAGLNSDVCPECGHRTTLANIGGRDA